MSHMLGILALLILFFAFYVAIPKGIKMITRAGGFFILAGLFVWVVYMFFTGDLSVDMFRSVDYDFKNE